MSQQAKQQNRNVVFRRIGGRVVPIATGTAGLGVAADAARTKRVYENVRRGITIDRKLFARQPYVTFWSKDSDFFKLGQRLNLKVKGKSATTVSFYRGAMDGDPKSFGISWLRTKSKFRGQGLSKIITRQAGVEIREKGGRYTWNQVVHSHSLQTNFNRVRDSLWKETKKPGEFVRVTKAQALKNIRTWRDKKGILTSEIFRETQIPRLSRKMAPYRTTANKVAIGAGLGLAALSAGAYLYLNRKPKKENHGR